MRAKRELVALHSVTKSFCKRGRLEKLQRHIVQRVSDGVGRIAIFGWQQLGFIETGMLSMCLKTLPHSRVHIER